MMVTMAQGKAAGLHFPFPQAGEHSELLDDAAPPPSPTAYSNDAEGKTAEAEEEATDVAPPQQRPSSPAATVFPNNQPG